MLMKNHTVLLTSMLFLLLGIAATLQAQENPMPEFADPVSNPFGLVSPSDLSNAIIRLKLVDINHDGKLEAFVRSATNGTSGNLPQDLWYFENDGSNENPRFVFEDAYPFGIPGPGPDWIHQFVDIDGDGLEDLFFTSFALNNPVKMLSNHGSLQGPDFEGDFEENPYGISLPVSDAGNDVLDGVMPNFVDIDADGDYDLFYSGLFLNSGAPSAFYFSWNEDLSGNGTAPLFTLPEKNPFGLVYPSEINNLWRIKFVDADCDGDQDFYLFGFPGPSFFYFENTGTPFLPDFSAGPQNSIEFFPFTGDFLDIGGDGDLDLISVVGQEILFYENLSAPEMVDFNYTQDSLAFEFTGNSSDNATSWLWDFGDGTASDLQNPQHIYSQNGAYAVCLTARGDLPCSNTICDTVYAPVFPWHETPVPNPFGLNGLPPFSLNRFRDFDNDGTLEAFTFTMTGGNQLYENTGDNAAPQFELEATNPFGIPPFVNAAEGFPFDFIDINGDGNLDIFLASFRAENPLLFLENTGTPGQPWFGDSQVQSNPFGFVQPTSDSFPNQHLGGFSWPTFVDIDADNDYDLFFSGQFAQPDNPVFDENIYFYRNDDPSGTCTDPRFTGPIKNPFNLEPPVFVPDANIVSRFVDTDCDGDWDLFLTYAGTLIAYFENTGTPENPDFSGPPVIWWASNQPRPVGFNSFVFGDWMDIGGDRDMDYISGAERGIFYENISDGAMACQGPVKVGTKESHLDAHLLLYPTPAHDVLGISLQSNEPLGGLEIEIFDMLGRRAKRLSRQPVSNMLQETISLNGLTVGAYIVRISSKGKSIARRFVRME